MASPLVTTPPGVLMYSMMSFSWSSLSRNRSWAMIRLATWSSIGSPRKMIRSFRSRE
jgi:hypothetical protein